MLEMYITAELVKNFEQFNIKHSPATIKAFITLTRLSAVDISIIHIGESVPPMVYTGPSLLFRLGKANPEQMSTKSFQPGWDVGIGLDIINFIQLSAGYRFGLGNAITKSIVPGACIHTNGWNVSANIIFDF